MARLMLGKEEIVGVDVGASATKIVHAELTGEGILVRSAFSVDTPDGCMRDGIVVEPLDVGEKIRSKLRDYQVGARTAVASVSGATVTVRPAKVPQMPERALRKSIRYEAARHISTAVDESAVEFEVIQPDAGGGDMEVLLVAAPEAMVNAMVRTAEVAGLDAVAVDLDSFAMYRTLVETNKGFAREGKTVVMLDLGASHTDLQIIAGGRFVLDRTLPICGDSLTRAIEPVTGGDREAAERLKKEVDLAARPAEEGGKDRPEIRAARAVVPLLEEMVREIKRSIQYYFQADATESRGDVTIDQVILGGGGAQLAGLAEFLTAKLETPVSVGNPLDSRAVAVDTSVLNLEDTIRQAGPVYATALGLAMKEHPAFAQSRQSVKPRKRRMEPNEAPTDTKAAEVPTEKPPSKEEAA
jgi:type IV pilus assembly protein PilM